MEPRKEMLPIETCKAWLQVKKEAILKRGLIRKKIYEVSRSVDAVLIFNWSVSISGPAREELAAGEVVVV